MTTQNTGNPIAQNAVLKRMREIAVRRESLKSLKSLNVLDAGTTTSPAKFIKLPPKTHGPVTRATNCSNK